MEVPAKLRSTLVGLRYWLMALILFASSTIFISCGGTDTTVIIVPQGSKIGATIDGIFEEGVLNLGVIGDLSAGGTTAVTVELVDAEGVPITQAVEINFSSACAESGIAALDSPVTTINGTAQAIYQADGCVGEDTIIGTAFIGDQTLIAMATLTVAVPTSGSIQFVSATPATIILSGTGGIGSAEVVFKVIEYDNQPLSGQIVNFSLSTSVGGTSLANTSDVSNEEGEVSTIVFSGNVPTSVRVTATVQDTDVSTVSDSLVISTGLPDQDSFSLSVDIFNPEAWQFDGETISLNIRAADHYNNPVPDGTAIYFTTEGGSIDPQCNTLNGGCSVTWESQNPRPLGSIFDNAGLSTIYATALGEEVIVDIDGDGLFSLEDKAHWDTNPGLDLPEAFRDDNLNGNYDLGETFFDFNADGVYSPANGLFNGTLCTDDGIIDGVCTRDLVHVRETIVISMSGSFAEMDIFDENFDPIDVICLRDLKPGDPGYIDANNDGCNDVPGVSDPGLEEPNCDNVGNFLVRVADVNDNSMPLNTTVTATSSLGEMLGTSSYTIDNTIFPAFLLFSIQEVCGGVPEAQIEVRAVTPKGNETIRTFTVLDDG